jgi:membrane protein
MHAWSPWSFTAEGAVVTSSDRSAVEVEQIVARTPRRLQPAVAWLMATWLGRCLLRIAARFVRLEMFDRSMTVAAQVFTSVFPILIMAAVLLGGRYSDDIADAVDMPDETRIVMQEALATPGGSAFGIVGTLVVLISATSLSRALTRTFAAIWNLPRPKAGLVSAWRWLGAVLLLAAYVVLVRLLSELDSLPAADIWGWIVPLTLDTVVAVLLPSILLSGQVPVRLLLPGAMVFGLIMLAVRPASSVFLPRALDVSADRYGTIGVAFTYIAWLYAISLCFLVAALVGEVIATDQGWLGRWIRGGADESGAAVTPSAAPESTSRG